MSKNVIIFRNNYFSSNILPENSKTFSLSSAPLWSALAFGWATFSRQRLRWQEERLIVPYQIQYVITKMSRWCNLIIKTIRISLSISLNFNLWSQISQESNHYCIILCSILPAYSKTFSSSSALPRARLAFGCGMFSRQRLILPIQ